MYKIMSRRAGPEQKLSFLSGYFEWWEANWRRGIDKSWRTCESNEREKLNLLRSWREQSVIESNDRPMAY